MKKLILILFLINANYFSAISQTKAEIIVKELETKRFAALVNKDFDFLDKVFSDKLEYFHSSGVLDNKETYLGNLKAGKTTYLEITPLNIDTKEYAKNVVINRGKAQLRVKTVNDGKPYTLYFTTVYVKEKSDWRAVSWQATRLPN
jgi:ketosteroid isomerase-like protein